MKPDEFGGTQPTLIVGNQQHKLPDYCTVLDFNQDGCTITDLRRSDDLSVNWADSEHEDL